jgi:hypothetical protein
MVRCSVELGVDYIAGDVEGGALSLRARRGRRKKGASRCREANGKSGCQPLICLEISQNSTYRNHLFIAVFRIVMINDGLAAVRGPVVILGKP